MNSPQACPPLPFDAALEAWRVDDPAGVRSVLVELMEVQATVQLWSMDGQCALGQARIESVDERVLALSLQLAGPVADPPRPPFIVCGHTPALRVQFRCSASATSADSRGAPARLTGPLPDCVYRIQQREAFRVEPLDPDLSAVVWLQDGQGGATAHRLLDISAAGLALLWPATGTAPEAGERWSHARIERDGERDSEAPIPCTLQVVRATPVAGGLKVSCRFVGMPAEPARNVQRFVIDIERQRNARRARN